MDWTVLLESSLCAYQVKFIWFYDYRHILIAHDTILVILKHKFFSKNLLITFLTITSYKIQKYSNLNMPLHSSHVWPFNRRQILRMDFFLLIIKEKLLPMPTCRFCESKLFFYMLQDSYKVVSQHCKIVFEIFHQPKINKNQNRLAYSDSAHPIIY